MNIYQHTLFIFLPLQRLYMRYSPTILIHLPTYQLTTKRMHYLSIFSFQKIKYHNSLQGQVPVSRLSLPPDPFFLSFSALPLPFLKCKNSLLIFEYFCSSKSGVPQIHQLCQIIFIAFIITIIQIILFILVITMDQWITKSNFNFLNSFLTFQCSIVSEFLWYINGSQDLFYLIFFNNPVHDNTLLRGGFSLVTLITSFIALCSSRRTIRSPLIFKFTPI